MAEKETIKRFIVRDPHGHVEQEDSFSVVGDVEVTVDGNVGEPSAESTYENGQLKIDFHNMKGDPGNGITDIEVDEQEGDEAINTVTIKTEDNPEGTAFQVRNGSRGNGIVSISEQVSDQDGGVNTFTIADSDGTQYEIHTRNGRKGDKGEPGDSVIVGEGDLPLAHVTGQSTEKAMSQKGVTDELMAIPSALGLAGYEVQNFDGYLDKAYVRDYSTYCTIYAMPSSNYKVYYYQVHAGETWLVRCDGAATANNVDYAILPSVPVAESTKYYNFAKNSGTANIELTIQTDGYLCVSRAGTEPCVCKKHVTATAAEKAREQVRDIFYGWESIAGVRISSYIINSYGRWVAQGSSWKTVYWPVSKGDVVELSGDAQTSYSAWAFFREEPTTEAIPNRYRPWSDTDGIELFTATEDGYVARSSGTIYPSARKLAAPDLARLQEYISYKPLFGKRCIFIGDSISTNNNYYWKGLLKTAYNIDYVTSEAGKLAPAAGGITIIPPTEEPSSVNTKSIWYRCAAQRMGAFDFDIISLMGGTNDMNDSFNSDLVIGTVDDTPYVDDAAGMAGVTDVRPETLTFAAAYKGCIEMLKRDFPTKEIILVTVLPCSGRYGNWTDQETGLIASEAIANLQVKIAELYGLRIVPMYWEVRTVAQCANKVFAQDGVHPNLPCAQRMRASFAKALCL